MVPQARFTLPMLAVLLGAAAAAREGWAESWRVAPSGPADATTIAEGLARAAPGDSVWVGPGTYLEHDLQLKQDLFLASEAGAEHTTIDAGLAGHGLIGADGATVRGFTIVRASGLNRAAVYCYQTSPAIVDNVFERHESRVLILFESNALIRGNTLRGNPELRIMESVIQASHSTPHIVDNLIEAIDPNRNAEAIELSDVRPAESGAARIENNRIVGKVRIGRLARPDTTKIYNNVFSGRAGIIFALGIAFNDGPLDIHHNTFVEGFGIDLQATSNVLIRNNIIVNAQTGIGASSSSELTLACNDVWNNAFNYLGVEPGDNDISVDPLFCRYSRGEYGLKVESPCRADNAPPGCGDMGAALPACSETSVQTSPWSAVKSRFR